MKADGIENSIELSGAEAWAIVTGVPLCPVEQPEWKAEPFFLTAGGIQFGTARIREDGCAVLELLACPNAVHGSPNPKIRKGFAKVRELVKRGGAEGFVKFPEQNENDCPVCRGARWLEADSNEAAGVVVMAHSFAIFRGVRIPGRSGSALTDSGQLSMIKAALSGTNPAADDRAHRKAPGVPAASFPHAEGRDAFFSDKEDEVKP